MRKFFARVIVIPAALETWVTAAIMTGFMWLAAVVLTKWGLDLSAPLAVLASGVAALLTFTVKALLERVPEKYHVVINAVLSWIALLVGGSALLPVFMRLLG